MKKILLTILLFSSVLLFSQSPTCESASAICSGQGGPYNNTNNTTPGGNSGGYGTVNCLFSTPYPAWFYMQVGVSGSMDFTLVQTVVSGNPDVDFALWGPFTSLNNYCDNLFGYSAGYTGPNNVVDCSYSGSATETINIPGATAGQYYILLVTNYGQQPGSYTINQTGGTGSLSCEIVCGVDLGPDQLFCNSTVSSYTMTATFNQAPTTAGTPTYSWYLGGALQATTTTNQYTTSQEGTWTVEVVRPGCSDVATDDIEILFDSEPVLNSPGSITGCPPFNLTAIIPGLVAPEDPADYVVYFYEDLGDAYAGNTNYIADPSSYTPGVTDIFIRVENDGNPTCANADEILQLIIDCPDPCTLTLTSAVATDNQTVCLNQAIDDIVFAVGGDATDAVISAGALPAGVTGTYTAGTFTISGTPTAIGVYNATVSTVGCVTDLTYDITITVTDLPVLTSLAPVTTPICEGETAVFDLVGTANATVTYSINGGASQTLVLDASGNGQVTIAGATVPDQTITLSDIAIGSCNAALTDTATVVVNPNPILTGFSSNNPICLGDDATFDIVGTANAVVSYTINGGAVQTTTLDATGNSQIVIVAPAADQTMVLSDITLGTCSVALTNSETVTVNPTPTLTSIAPVTTPICEGQSAVFDLVGSANATITYSVNGGASQTLVLDASGNGQVSIAGATVPDQTITLSDIAIGSCNTALTDTATVVVNPNPVFTSVTAVTTPICEGETAIFDLVGTANATVTYSINGGAAQTLVLDASGNGQVSITSAAADQVITLSDIVLNGCNIALTDTATVVVNPNPVFTSVTPNTPICEGETAVFDLVGTANATVTYSINGGASQTLVLDASGNGQVTIASATADQTITLSDIVLNGCNITLIDTATIVVNPNPSFTSVTAVTTPICEGEAATFDLVGSANATVTYSINGGAAQTVVLDASGNGQVSVASAAAGQTITLSDIVLNGCNIALTDTATVVVNPNPVFTSVTPNTPICEGDTATFDLVGTANATVTYSINGGASQTVVLDASGNGQVTIASATVDQTITLSDIVLNGCNITLIDTATIVVNPNPAFTSVTAVATPICEGEAATFDLVGSANATVTYSINGGAAQTVVLDASGNGQVSVASAAAGQTITLSDIVLNGCNIALTDTATVVVNPNPVFTSVTPNTPICEGDTATFDLVGTANATVTYSINGGVSQTLVLDASGNGQVSITGATADQTITLSDIVLNGCNIALTDTATVVVNPNPVFTSVTAVTTPICEGETAVFDLVGTANATVSYSINGGASQTLVLDASGNGQVSIASATADQTITLSDIALNGCNIALTDTATVVVNPNPVFTSVTPNTPICEGDTAIFDLVGTANATVSYSINGGASQTLVLDASGNGQVSIASATADQTITLSDIVLNGCNIALSNTATVVISPNAEITLTSDVTTTTQEICENSAIDTITYELSNGATDVTITGLPAGITYTVTGNVVTISGTSTDVVAVYNYSITTIGGCSTDTEIGSIEITNGVLPTFAAMPDICEGTGYSLPLTSTNGITGTWSPAFDNTQTTTYTFTPNAGQCAIQTTATVTIIETPTLTIDNGLPIVLCDGEFLDIDWSSDITGTTLTYTASSNNVTYPSSGDESTLDQVLNLINTEQIGDITITITPHANGCSGTPVEVQVRINPNPIITSVVVDEDTVCSGSEVTFTVMSNLGGTTYDWTVVNNMGVTVVGGVTSGTISTGTLTLELENSTAGVPGSLEVQFTPTRDGCPGASMISVPVTVNPIPGVPNGLPEYWICDGTATPMSITSNPMIAGTQLMYDVVDYHNVTGYSSGGPLAEPLLIQDVLTLTNSYEEGYVVYRIWATLNGCEGEYRDFTVHVNPNPQPILTDGAICINELGDVFQTYWLTVEGVSGANYQYTWYESSDPNTPIAITTVPNLEVDIAGSYYVVVEDNNYTTGCEGTSNTASVIEIQPASSFTTTVTDAFTDNATVVVSVSGGNGVLLYQIDGGAFQESNVFTGVSAGEHTITVIDSQGCTYLQDTVLVIDYPPFFTPNGDGYNDTWNIVGLNQSDAKLYIFDRYGKLIKQISTVGQGWDGTYNGEQLPSTDYWFSLQYQENGVAKEFKAHFALKR